MSARGTDLSNMDRGKQRNETPGADVFSFKPHARVVLLVAAAMLVTLVVHARAQDFPLLGQGNLSCSTWLERRAGDGGDRETMVSWVLGYITAFNQYAADPGIDISAGQKTEELTGWIDDYCRQNSTAKLQQASAALVEELRRNAAR